jgi:hypothetical protein
MVKALLDKPADWQFRVTCHDDIEDLQLTASHGELMRRLRRTTGCEYWVINEWERGRRHLHGLIRGGHGISTSLVGNLWRAVLPDWDVSHQADEVYDQVAIAKYLTKLREEPPWFRGNLYSQSRGFFPKPVTVLMAERRRLRQREDRESEADLKGESAVDQARGQNEHLIHNSSPSDRRFEMRDLKIDPEFFAYLPRHTPEEHQRLEEQLLTDGCRDPIVVWKGKDIIVDGMERQPICLERNIAFCIVEVEFKNREAVKTWMSANQLSRRNLAGEAFNYHLGRYYIAHKGQHGGLREGQASGGRTAEKIAEQHGVSASKVKRASKFAAALDAAAAKSPELRDAVLRQNVKVSQKALEEIAELPSPAAKQRVETILNGTPNSDAAVEQRDYPPKILDGLGKVVTDERLLGVFSDRENFIALLNQARALESAVHRLSKSDGGANLDIELLDSAFKLIKAQLNDRIPMVRCSICKGDKCVEKDGKNVECDKCLAFGFISKFAYEHSKKMK